MPQWGLGNTELLTQQRSTEVVHSEGNLLIITAAAAAKLLQLCPTLCDPIEGSPPGSPTPGILQARTLEWVAISFSNAWKWKVKVKLLSRVWLLATHGLQPTRLLHPWDFPGKSTGVGCHCLLHNHYYQSIADRPFCLCALAYAVPSDQGISFIRQWHLL